MNPTLMAALAAERHAELLRHAEVRRRATSFPRRSDARTLAATAGAALRRRSAAALQQPAACRA